MKRPSTRKLREAANLFLTLARIKHFRRRELPVDVDAAFDRAAVDLERLSVQFSDSWDDLRAAKRSGENSVGDGS